MTNCYSTGSVAAADYCYAGGVVGRADKSCVTNCAALNPSVQSRRYANRVAVVGPGGSAANNAAWDGMTVNGSVVTSGTAENADGEDITAFQIDADGTIGEHFNRGPWTTDDTRLPGLFGETVPMPRHLWRPCTVKYCISDERTAGDPLPITMTIGAAYDGSVISGDGTLYDPKHGTGIVSGDKVLIGKTLTIKLTDTSNYTYVWSIDGVEIDETGGSIEITPLLSDEVAVVCTVNSIGRWC